MLFCIVMLVMLEGARRDARSALALEYRYKLFELRDELRSHVIRNPELARNWVFLYLDSTITKFVTLLPRLSLWHMLALLFTHRNDHRFKVHRMHLEREYDKVQNAKFKQIEVKLMATVGQYIAKKHACLTIQFELMRKISLPVVRGCIVVARRIRKDSLEVAVEAPETSTLGEYCPA